MGTKAFVSIKTGPNTVLKKVLGASHDGSVENLLHLASQTNEFLKKNEIDKNDTKSLLKILNNLKSKNQDWLFWSDYTSAGSAWISYYLLIDLQKNQALIYDSDDCLIKIASLSKKSNDIFLYVVKQDSADSDSPLYKECFAFKETNLSYEQRLKKAKKIAKSFLNQERVFEVSISSQEDGIDKPLDLGKVIERHQKPSLFRLIN